MPTTRRTCIRAAAILVAALVAGGGASSARAREEARSEPVATATKFVDDCAGAYRFAGGAKERKALEDAIDDVVDDMSFIVRGIARKRLREANRIAAKVSIARKGNQLTISFDERRYTATINGGPVKVAGVTGDTVELQHKVDGHRIRQIFQGEDGGRVNKITLDGEGRLKIRVRVFSERLPKELRYTLTYAK